MPPAPATYEAIIRRARASRRARVVLARTDPNTFMELVLRDEKTHKPFVQAPVHRAWQKLVTEHNRLILWSHVEGGKSQQVAVGRVLWELGKNPNIRIVILSNVHSMATKLTRLIANYIETSAELHEVFPHLRPSSREKDPWTESKLTVERDAYAKEASVEAFGVHGNVMGARIDMLVMDDVLDAENTRSPEQRQALASWFEATIMGRLTDESRVIVIGNAWHREDLLHDLARRGWRAFTYPVKDAEGNLRWPEKWPQSRIDKVRADMLPREFARQLMCQVYDSERAIFAKDAVGLCLRRGHGYDLIGGFKMDPGVPVFCGVDLAVKKHEGADLTCFFTIAVNHDGSRVVCNIDSGRWNGFEIKQKLIDKHVKFRPIFIVEDNAAQAYLIDILQATTAIPIIPYTTTAQKKLSPEFGLQSMAVEMQNAKWVIPNTGGIMRPEVDAWVQEMFGYDPDVHTGDRLMASWFAREGIRLAGGREGPRAEVVRLDTLSR